MSDLALKAERVAQSDNHALQGGVSLPFSVQVCHFIMAALSSATHPWPSCAGLWLECFKGRASNHVNYQIFPDHNCTSIDIDGETLLCTSGGDITSSAFRFLRHGEAVVGLSDACRSYVVRGLQMFQEGIGVKRGDVSNL